MSLSILNRALTHTPDYVPPYYLANIVAGSINSLHPLLPEFSRRCVTTSAVSTSFAESRSPSCSREGEATIPAFLAPRRELSRPCNIVADIVSTRESENRQWANTPSSPRETSFLLFHSEEKRERGGSLSMTILPNQWQSIGDYSESVSQSVSQSIS